MRLRDGSKEAPFVTQELLSSLQSCSDLLSVLRCLREVLRHVVAIEDLVLLVKTAESQHVMCISNESTFQVADFPEEMIALRPPAAAAENAIDSLPFCLEASEPQVGIDSALAFSTNGYELYPLRGMAESFIVLGVLFSGRQAEAAYHAFFQQLATSIGAAVDNVILRERMDRFRGTLRRSVGHITGLRDISQACVTKPTLQDLIEGISANVREKFGTEILCLLRHRPETEDMLWAAMHFPNGQGRRVVGTTTPLRQTRNGGTIAIKTGQSVLADGNMLRQTANENCISTLLALKAKTYYAVPLLYCGRIIGVLSPAHVKKTSFTSEEIALWDDCAAQVSLAMKCLSGIEDTDLPLGASTAASCYEVRQRNEFPGLVGDSHALRRMLSQVETVAPTDASVLLTGETGSGKGMVAESIHRLSRRRSKPFVVLNCAAIPATLLECEMFGHERGAFTGAFSRRAGRLEQANGGTVFFDEIGELPLELQPKLLRAIQEQRIERLGGNTSVQLDVRFVWATNRNLEQMVKDKQFRSDLYYRISVFPIAVPSLAERREDIEGLAYYFLQECNRRMNKNIESIPADVMKRLQNREWDGNIRELRNVIERAAILTNGRVLELPCDAGVLHLTASGDSIPAPCDPGDKTWEEIERSYLLQALRDANGVIAKAAKRLQLKRTTLDSRLRRLGVTQMELEAMRSNCTTIQ